MAVKRYTPTGLKPVRGHFPTITVPTVPPVPAAPYPTAPDIPYVRPANSRPRRIKPSALPGDRSLPATSGSYLYSHHLFTTLTYGSQNACSVGAHTCARTRWANVSLDFNRYITTLRRRLRDKSIQYVRCFEAHKSGYPHVHVLLQFPTAVRYTSRSGRNWIESPDYKLLRSLWRHGHTDYQVPHSASHGIRYIAKYMTKNATGRRMWSHILTARESALAEKQAAIAGASGAPLVPFLPDSGPSGADTSKNTSTDTSTSGQTSGKKDNSGDSGDMPAPPPPVHVPNSTTRLPSWFPPIRSLMWSRGMNWLPFAPVDKPAN